MCLLNTGRPTCGPVAIPKFPPRPGYGTRGRRIPLWTNFFKVKIPSDLTLFHYDVEILPTVPRAVKRKVMQAAVEKDRAKFSGQFPVFDGEQALYCHKKMNDNEASVYTIFVCLFISFL